MKELKTSEIVNAYKLIKVAKFGVDMQNGDKFAVLNATRAFRGIANEYDEFFNDVVERLKGDNHDAMVEALTAWRQQERAGNVTLGEEERKAVAEYFSKYEGDVAKCLHDESIKVHELDYKQISEEAFSQLISVKENDWNMEQILLLQDILC